LQKASPSGSQGLPGQQEREAPASPTQSPAVKEAQQEAKEHIRKLDENTDAIKDNTEVAKQQAKAQQELSQTGNRIMRVLFTGLLTPMALSSSSKALEGVAQSILARYSESAKFAPSVQWSIWQLQHRQTLLSAESTRILAGPLAKLASAIGDAQRAWAPIRNLLSAGVITALTVGLRGLAGVGNVLTSIQRGVNEILKTITFGAVDLNKWMEDQNKNATNIAAEFFGKLTRGDWHGLVPPPRPNPRFDRPLGPLRPREDVRHRIDHG